MHTNPGKPRLLKSLASFFSFTCSPASRSSRSPACRLPRDNSGACTKGEGDRGGGGGGEERGGEGKKSSPSHSSTRWMRSLKHPRLSLSCLRPNTERFLFIVPNFPSSPTNCGLPPSRYLGKTESEDTDSGGPILRPPHRHNPSSNPPTLLLATFHPFFTFSFLPSSFSAPPLRLFFRPSITHPRPHPKNLIHGLLFLLLHLISRPSSVLRHSLLPLPPPLHAPAVLPPALT